MINKDKIVFNTKTYYTPTYGSPIGVKILKLFDDGCVLVKGKNAPFVRPLMYVYNTAEDARKGGKDWEHDERKRKRDKKKKIISPQMGKSQSKKCI